MPLSATRTLLRSPRLRELREAPLEGARFLARAWAAIFAVEASLNTVGYKRTLAWIEAVPASRSRGPGPSVELGERLVRAAYRAHAFRGGCLPRSLVQYLLHRRDGTAARFVVGVRRAVRQSFPRDVRQPLPRDVQQSLSRGIEAHAWVASPEMPASPDVGQSLPRDVGQSLPRDEGFAPIFQTEAGRWSPAGASAKGDRTSSLRRPGR